MKLGMTNRYALDDAHWQRIKDLLPGQAGQFGVTARDNQLFLDAVLYRYRAGIPWRDLPERFGDFRVVHTCHSRWSRSGVWCRVFEILAQDADNEYVSIDATIVRAHQHSAGAKRGDSDKPAIGRSRGGLSTKIHATIDVLSNPTGFHFTLGQNQDLQGTDILLKGTPGQTVIADKAYDAQAKLVQALLDKSKEVVIASRCTNKQPRVYGRHLYQAQHYLIENFFARLKQHRAIGARYDKTARNFLGAIHLVASMVWLA